MKQNLLFNRASAFGMRFIMVLTMLLIVGVGQAWGAEGDTHDFTQTLSQLLNNNATISSITIPEQSYAIKEVKITCKYNKTAGGVTMTVSVGGTSWGNATHNQNTTSTYSFTGTATKGSTVISFKNNCGSGTGKGTFYVTNVQLVEGAPAKPYTVTFHTTATKKEEIEEASAGAGVTPPTMEEECGEWEFQGWSESSSNSETNTTELSLVTLTDGIYYPAKDVDLYPVYTKTEEGGGSVEETLAQTLQYDTWSYSGSTTDKTSYRLFHSNSYVESAEFDLSTLSKVVVYGGTFGGDSYNKLTIAGVVGGKTTTWKSVTVSGNSQTGVNTYTGGTSLSGTGKLRVTSNSGSSSSSGVRMSKILIYTLQATSTTYYYSYPQCITETTVSLDPNGGEISDTNWTLENGVYKLTTKGESITLPSITRTGYTFGGWATSSGGTKEHNANATITLNGTPVTLYAIWTANTYNITYKDQGNVAFSGTHDTGYPTQHTYGTETTLKGATKTGYTLDGWYTDAACTNKVTTLGATDYTGNITLYAKWIVNTHTLTWNVNGGDALTGTYTSGTVEYGAAITPPDFPTRNGYDFTYWHDGTNIVNEPATTMPDHDLTYTAQWEAVVYSISYQGLEGASNNANNPDTYTIESETITFEAPGERAGYNFAGWTPASIAKGSTGDLTVTANWTEKALTNYRTFCDVVCDAYSFHTGSDDDRAEWLKEAIKCFTKEGGYEHEWQIKDYIIPNDDDKFFVGNYGYFYNDNLGIGGANGKSRSVVSDWGNMYLAPAMDENDAEGTPRIGHAKGAKGTLRIFEDSNWDNLFVGFIPDGYKLKFGNEEYTFAMHNEGDREYRSEVVMYNSTNTDKNVSVGVVDADGKYVATNHTQKMRHIFLNTGGTSYWEADNVDNFALYDITNQQFTCLMHKTGYPSIYEGWVPTTCAKIIFVRLKSSTIDWSNAHNQTVDITLDAAKNLYTINNWNQSDNKSGGTWSVYERYGQFAMHDNSKSKNWYVHFVPHYVLTYDKNADDATGTMDIQTVAVDAADKKVVVANCGFTRPGYEFESWRKGETSTYFVAGVNHELVADVTFYAKWKAKKITIIWDANGGSVDPTTSTYTYNGTPVELPTPTRANYIFNGWFTATSGGTQIADVGTTNKPTDDVTYYAQWTEKAVPTFAWSADSYTAALEADNTYPTLNNPDGLSPITYTSSNTGVATIDANGNITLVATGTTTITADGAETATHKSATDSYELTVVAANCKWVETTTIEDGDEVVITMTKGNYVWTISNEKHTSSTAPTTVDISANVEGQYLTTVNDGNKWVIEKNNDNLTFYSYTDQTNYLYCTNAENGVRVGTGTAKVFVVDGNYLKNTQTTDPRYIGVSVNTNPYSWRCYTVTTGVIKDQTLKFYKKVCLDSEHYWVTWDAGEGAWTDGSSKKLESYEVGATITAPAEDPTREGYRFDGWTPAPGTIPAENTTFTAKWTEVYKITWYENGVPSYTYVPSDNAVVTWEDNIADCGEKKFYGWTADDTFVSDPTTPPTLISKGTTIAGDVTYFAVYADAEVPANPGYTKVTTISEGTYLIATGETSGNKAYTGKYPDKTYGGTCDVTVNNQVISTKPTSAVEVEVTLGTGANSGKFAIYDGTYYLSAPSSNDLTFNNNIVYDWKLTSEGHINSTSQTSRYIQLNSSANPNRFACYTGTQKYAYLYKKKTTTYKNFAVSCDKYTITVAPDDGTVTTTPADEAGAGQEITINVTPDDCKYLTALKCNYDSDHSDYSIDIYSTPYKFTMLAANVTVTATFADKTATNIEILTSAHRMLMQGSAFVGEQVRITYNNGDEETLNWNDSRLTFSGYNTANLGSQTVTITYNGCGTQSASYNIEVIDGLGVTFWDGDYTETIKYEPGDLVDVDNKIGQSICDGWKFVGWSETKVANESNGFTPVHNFNATEPKTLYAVYVQTSTDWISAYNIDELHSGAKYVIVARYSNTDNYYALTNTSTNASYLDGALMTNPFEQIREGDAYPYKDRYKLKVNPDENWKWQLVNTGSGWTMRNISANKYLKINSDKTISLTATPDDKFTLRNGDNDSEITAQSSSNNYLSWYNSSKYWNGHTSGKQYYLTNETNFTSTPPCSPLYATFYGNGGIVTDGIKSGDYLIIEEPTRDAGITTPTASFADCNGKSWTFVGWAREEIDVTRVPVLTTDLLHDGGGNQHYYIQENGEEFWAIFTNTGESETKYGTITFTDADVTRQYENAKTIRKSVTAMGDYDFELYRVSKASSMGIQIDHNSTTKGYIKNITSLGKINSISFNDFQTGDIDDVKVYVGNTPNAINTLLTEEDLQQTGNTYTYYPQKNYAYVRIEADGYWGITSISIDFGKGTQVWATTPNCSDIFLSGNELYVTSTKGRAVMAPATLTVKANQLEANADVILTSNSSDVYFSTDRTFNFAAGQAANQKPKTSLTLSTDAEGNLATTDVYIHYMPSSEGNGVPADVVISANLETPNPSISDDHTIHVRNLPAKFVIATKVGATWYALPANMTGETNPLAEVIEVDETTMTATAPNTSTYTLWPVKTTNGTGNRYTDYGDRLRFAAVNYEQRGLWANNNNNSSAIKNYAVINSLDADGLAAYEWKVTTTVVDGRWQYTLQTDQTQNQNYLRYWTSAEGTPVGPKWGTYNAGENKLYFLPVTEAQPFEYAVVEWYPTKVLIQTDAAITSPTVKVNGVAVASPILTNKGGKLYEISNLPLETNPNKLLQVRFTDNAINYINTKVVPIILSRGEKTITGEPFATLTQKVYQYADVVVRDGATLSIDGTTDVANTLLGVTIYPTAKVSVDNGKKLSVHNLTFFGGIDEIYNGSSYEINKYGVPQLSLKGILNKTVTTIDYIMRVDLEQMYQVGVPYDVNLSDITYWDGTSIELGEELYVSAYDGQKRANLESAWVWEVNWEEEEKVLKAGIGYTISADKQDATHEYSIIRMPMKSNIASSSTEVAKTVQVFAYANTNDVEITDNSKGWNFLSNPYMAAISGAEADSKLVVGHLDRDDVSEPWEWVDTYRYVTIPSDDGTYHYQQKFIDATLLPFKSFFLQIATSGELSFALESRQSAPARYLQTNNKKREVEFEVLLANDTRSDNLGFLIGEAYTPAYEINADLEKMIGSMSVYTIYNGYNLAYNALSPTNAEEQIPIGYVVPTVGEYTWALDESSNVEDIEHIYLYDYETSVITDLLTDVYTFTASEQKSDTRFAINVTLKSKDSTVTGLVNVNKDSEQSVKFIYNDKIYILHNGVIYDATGKFVETINK